ncbi:MAG: hypothetical protein ACJ74R_14065, partial [Gaiellaceae bacterium]
MVWGLVQLFQLPLSMRHSKLEPGSLELKVKVGVASLSKAGGAESMVVLGAVRSIVQVWLAGVASVLPAGSVARTSKLWLPAASAAVVWGLVHGFQPPPSIWQSKLEPGSPALKAKLGVVSLDGLAGPESSVVCGAVRSIVQVKLAGDASVFPET